MGEIAEMMLDGTLCECCGSFIGKNYGYPSYCSEQCAKDRGAYIEDPIPRIAKNKCLCPTCGKRVKKIGLEQHMADKHGVITCLK